MTLHPHLTVLVAPNGAGKTTLLDAARITLWPFIKAFDLGSMTGKSATIAIDDVRLHRSPTTPLDMEPMLPCVVTGKGEWNNTQRTWSQTRAQIKPNTKAKGDNQSQEMTAWASTLQEHVRNQAEDAVDLPVVVYLGTGRLWYQGRYVTSKNDTQLDNSAYSRLWAYQNCLTSTSSYKQFEAWYSWIWRSYRDIQIEALEKNIPADDTPMFNNIRAAINTVQSAINRITETTTGWKDLIYSVSLHQQLVMTHPEQGSIPLALMSDGLRNIVAMVSDIAFRCIKLNPHFGEDAAQRTSGIVMIDEVDMFLHPEWQQQILPSLMAAFPNIQFIVTTHSPQVLSSVPDECIRIFSDGQVYEGPQGTQGAESSRVLKQVFSVEPRPKNDAMAILLKEYLDLVYADKWDDPEALTKKETLIAHFGDTEPTLTQAALYIENKRWEQGLEESH